MFKNIICDVCSQYNGRVLIFCGLKKAIVFSAEFGGLLNYDFPGFLNFCEEPVRILDLSKIWEVVNSFLKGLLNTVFGLSIVFPFSSNWLL